jgi:parallel beta-helix repeat protein
MTGRPHPQRNRSDRIVAIVADHWDDLRPPSQAMLGLESVACLPLELAPKMPMPHSLRLLRHAVLAAAACIGCETAAAITPCSDGGRCVDATPPTSPLCPDAGRCVVLSSTAKESDIAAAFASVQNGDTIVFPPGTFSFSNLLALGTADNVSVVGSGADKTVLDFHGQKAGEESLFAQSVSNLRYEGFTIQDSPGNGIKTLSVTGITFRSLVVTWTAMDKTDGAYGLYPVQSQNVLIEHCTVSGASDSGIYVGQSQDIVVRNNEVFANVGGIEIENSFRADVHDNQAHDNTAGILVFDLPGLQQEGGHSIRVYSNTIATNNKGNFAAMGDIVGLVPAGTGFFVMANHDVEIFQNTFTDNKTGSAGIVSYAVAQMPFTDPNYVQYPSRVYLHDNTYTGGGTQPDLTSQIGLLLLTGLSAFPGGRVPDVFYDGIVDPNAPAGPNPMTICLKEASTSTVCNGHLDQLNMSNSNLAMITVCDPAPYACSLPPLPAVTFPGLSQ